MKYTKGFDYSFWLLFGLVLFLSIGWVLNIIDIINANFNDITGLLVLRIIGIFIAPLGAVLGYF